MSEPKPAEGFPALFWWVVIGSILSLGTGVTLLVLSQTGKLGDNNGAAGPGLPSTRYLAGQRVDIWRNESWHPGNILSVDGTTYRVRYDENKVFGEEIVDASRLREARP